MSPFFSLLNCVALRLYIQDKAPLHKRDCAAALSEFLPNRTIHFLECATIPYIICMGGS